MIKTIAPVEQSKDEVTFNIASDDANMNWLQSRRLLKRALRGSAQAAEKLLEMSQSSTYKEVEDV